MKLVFFVLLTILTTSLLSQVIPKPGHNLTHTQVMFEYPAVKNAVRYQLEISRWDSLKQVAVPYLKQFDNTTASLVSGLEFGFEYRWRYQAFDKKKSSIFTSPDYIFYIKKAIYPNLDLQRVRIIPHNCSDSLVGLVSMDYSKTFVNRKGNPVYYVPVHPPLLDANFNIRDLRMSSGGTITFLRSSDAFEMDLDGHIIWITPNDGKVSGETSEFYHHCFSKMENGNYMVLSAKHRQVLAADDTTHLQVEFETIIEYNQEGNVAWKWDSQDYMSNKDFLVIKNPDDRRARLANKQSNTKVDFAAHCNSFDVSPDGKYVYLGFRDISRIIKIEKKTRKVIASYGERMPSGEAMSANGFFMFQHSGNLLKDGNLVVFNNNDSQGEDDIVSSVVIFTDSANTKSGSRIVWQFNCNFDSLTNGKSLKTGNVLELPDHNLLVNMGTLNRTIEVTRNKKVVWDAFTEQWDPKKNQWVSFPQNKSSYISSLYPCYFTASITSETKKKKNEGTVSLEIFNEGTETDTYEVLFINSNNNTIKTLTQQILPENSVTIPIPLLTNELSRIKIVSSLDQRRYRIITFPDEKQESTLNSLPEIKIPDSPSKVGKAAGIKNGERK